MANSTQPQELRWFDNPYRAAIALMLGAEMVQMRRQAHQQVEFELSADDGIFAAGDRFWEDNEAVPVKQYVGAVRDIFSCLRTCRRGGGHAA